MFHCFPYFYRVICVCFKRQIASICATIVFWQNCRDVKNEVFEKKIVFFVLCFLMLLKEKQKIEKQQNGKGQKPIKIVSSSGGHAKHI